MRFFKRKKKSKHRKAQLTLQKNVVPMTTLTRWYLYDTDLENPNQVAVRFGMSPVSEEGDEKEVEDSDKRLTNILSLYPYIGAIADINAKAVASAQLLKLQESGDGIEENSSEFIIQELYRMIGHAAITSAFSTAIELGIVRLNDKKGSSHIVEEYDEF